MRRQVTLSEILDANAEALRNSLVHCLPGIVRAFTPGSAGRAPTVDVQPAVHDVRFDTETGERTSEPWPVLLAVPVQWPRFGGYVISGPLAPGDHVMLHAFDLDPSDYRTNGVASDPPDVRRHAGSYWVAVPGGVADPGAPLDGAAAGNELILGRDGGAPQIRISGSTIQLGATGGDSVALASLVATELGKIAAALAGAVAPSGGGPVTYASPYATPGSVASTLVKAQ